MKHELTRFIDVAHRLLMFVYFCAEAALILTLGTTLSGDKKVMKHGLAS